MQLMKFLMVSKLFKSNSTLLAKLAVPAFPGKQNISVNLLEIFKLWQIACSLPPLPIIPTFI